MKKITLVTCLFLLSTFGFSQTQPKLSKLAITITNIVNKNDKNLIIGIYRKDDSFPTFNTFWKNQIVSVNSNSTTIYFEVPYGEYAIAVSHDVNGNKKLDTNFFGIPKEPFGFSNNFKPKMSKPDFNDCKFTFSNKNSAISINLID